MNAREVWIVYLREIRSALRERSIVLYSLLMPVFLYPVFLWVAYSGLTFIQGVSEGFASRVALIGEVPPGHATLLDSLTAIENLELERNVQEEDAQDRIRGGDLDAALKFETVDVEGEPLAGNFRALIRYDGSESRSRTASERVENAVDRYREAWLEREAEGLGLSEADRIVFNVVSENASTDEDLGAMILGTMIPLFLILMVAIGAFYPAVDTTAGERERHTWETLMTTSAARGSILTAKYLYVATMGVVAGLLNVAAMFTSMGAVMAPLMGENEDVNFRLPLLAVPVMAAGAVGIALLLAAAMMILTAFARTFKDGQAMIQPVYLTTVFVPLLIGQQTDRTLTPELAAIPIANVAMMIRDAVNGIFLWPLILETLAVDLLLVVLCLWLARFILSFEDVLIGEFNGSFWRFLRDRVLAGERRPGRPSA